MNKRNTRTNFIFGIVGVIILIYGIFSISNSELSKYGIEVIVWIVVLYTTINCWVNFKKGMGDGIKAEGYLEEKE